MTNATRLPADLAGALALIESLTVQRDAAEALAKERTIERDNYGQELDKATGMVEMLVDDAEAARLLWRSSEKACAHIDAQRIAARDARDAAQQMVAELRAVLTAGRDIVIEASRRHTQWVEGANDILESSAHIAGRFCLASERDAAIARAEKAEGARDELNERFDVVAARAIAAEAENARLRHAAAEVLSWSLNDMTALLTNPPQNAALFHAQRVLREAMGD